MAFYSVQFRPKALARRVEIDVVIPSLNLGASLANEDPEYYQHRTETFPLLLCLCGFGESKESWSRNSQIVEIAEKNGFACAFISGDNKWYLNHGQIDSYYDLIERDIPDFLYGHFRNLSKEKPLVIAGVSMGGYGALYHYLKNKGKYAACIAMSPATKPDQLDEAEIGSLRDLFLASKDSKNHIYLSVGLNDFIIQASKEMDAFLADNDLGVRYKFIPVCDHSWNTWAKEIPCVVNYLRQQGILGELPPPPRRR